LRNRSTSLRANMAIAARNSIATGSVSSCGNRRSSRGRFALVASYSAWSSGSRGSRQRAGSVIHSVEHSTPRSLSAVSMPVAAVGSLAQSQVVLRSVTIAGPMLPLRESRLRLRGVLA
jgi:hypothetical protein